MHDIVLGICAKYYCGMVRFQFPSLGISAVQLSSILAGKLSYHCATVKGVCRGDG